MDEYIIDGRKPLSIDEIIDMGFRGVKYIDLPKGWVGKAYIGETGFLDVNRFSSVEKYSVFTKEKDGMINILLNGNKGDAIMAVGDNLDNMYSALHGCILKRSFEKNPNRPYLLPGQNSPASEIEKNIHKLVWSPITGMILGGLIGFTYSFGAYHLGKVDESYNIMNAIIPCAKAMTWINPIAQLLILVGTRSELKGRCKYNKESMDVYRDPDSGVEIYQGAGKIREIRIKKLKLYSNS